MPILLPAERDRGIVEMEHTEAVIADAIGEASPDAVVVSDQVVACGEDVRGVEADPESVLKTRGDPREEGGHLLEGRSEDGPLASSQLHAEARRTDFRFEGLGDRIGIPR